VAVDTSPFAQLGVIVDSAKLAAAEANQMASWTVFRFAGWTGIPVLKSTRRVDVVVALAMIRLSAAILETNRLIGFMQP
jgi:hypothetical protein